MGRAKSVEGINVDISVPTLIYGEDIELSLNKDQIICAALDIDGIKLEISIALD